MKDLQKKFDTLNEEHEKLKREKETMSKKLEDCEEIQFKLA